jgi:hypothetical protein
LKLSTQESQKENKDNFEYEWDEEEEEMAKKQPKKIATYT